MSESELKQFLLDHPRLLSTLFALTVLLSKVGTVAANGQSGTGP